MKSDRKRDSREIDVLRKEQNAQIEEVKRQSPYAIFQEGLDPSQAQAYQAYLHQYGAYQQ